MIEQGTTVICIRDGSDARNPWHAANPLMVGAQYKILRVERFIHADGRFMGHGYAVDNSGRLWGDDNFTTNMRFANIELTPAK